MVVPALLQQHPLPSHLLRVGSGVDVDQHGVPLALVKVVGKIEADLGGVVAELAADNNVLEEEKNEPLSES